ncbi:MAG: hypothetical protein LBH41_01710 [Rickettsiales bacterium]|jgi:hypothetical protein|nr:hypothetical protein [Rickettsiales bacterium]
MTNNMKKTALSPAPAMLSVVPTGLNANINPDIVSLVNKAIAEIDLRIFKLKQTTDILRRALERGLSDKDMRRSLAKYEAEVSHQKDNRRELLRRIENLTDNHSLTLVDALEIYVEQFQETSRMFFIDKDKLNANRGVQKFPRLPKQERATGLQATQLNQTQALIEKVR